MLIEISKNFYVILRVMYFIRKTRAMELITTTFRSGNVMPIVCVMAISF